MRPSFKAIFTCAMVTALVLSFNISAHAATQPYQAFNFSGFNWGQLLQQTQQPQQPQQPQFPWQPQQPQPAPQQPQPAPQQPDTTAPAQAGLTADEKKMLDLVNAERTQRGLAPLTANLEVTKVARIKAQDMIDNNYFSHNSPVYGSPFDMLKRFGISYRTAGENLAGNRSVDDAHNKLMNSSGHRANILNGSFKEVGIGIVNGGPYGKIMVQLFIG